MNTVSDFEVENTPAEPVDDRSSENPLIDWFSRRSSNQKILLTVGIPFAVLLAACGIAWWALLAIGREAAGNSAILEIAASARFSIAAVAMTGIVSTLAIGYIIQQDVVQKLHALRDLMHRLTKGDSAFITPYRDRPDEYGQMAASIEIFRRAALHMNELRERDIAAQTEKELAREQRNAELRELAERFELTVADVVGSVASSSSQLRTTATSMSDVAQSSSEKANQVASAMKEASSGATAAAAASDQFAMSIGEISRQAASSAELARKASASASSADKTISVLSSSAAEISQIVELIQSIAKRTNLLALNASIEAARGGEAGRGFAVVASEVKELAAQTSRATEDVAAQIRTMQDKTGASVKALETVGEQIQQLEATAISIAAAVDQQSVAGQDLARSIDLAARSSDRVSENISNVRETSLATGSAASQVLASATALEEQAEVLRGQVDQFLHRVRTA